ncbi:hypothetical protein KJ616_02840, partial [Patescibacteria group bacterium]|nr:hypothetical protein [Patescibacteria group bacterium]
MPKINIKIFLPLTLLIIVIAFAFFFVFQFKSEKEKEIKPTEKVLTQEDIMKFYQELSETVPGTKKYLNSFTLVENLGEGELRAEISSISQTTPDGAEIEAVWFKKGDGLFEAGHNFFAVSVDGARTTVSTPYDISETIKKEDSAIWNPQVFLNGEEVRPYSDTPTLLGKDPQNENYSNNILEWDYGICKRRLRLIEGGVLELYVFESAPEGDVEIKSNISGNLRASAPYAVDAAMNPLENFRVEEDRKILKSPDFNLAEFPVIVDDSFSASASDGYIGVYANSYSTARNSTDGSSGFYREKNTANSSTILGQEAYRDVYTGVEYQIFRNYFYFNTSAIPSGANITSAILSLRMWGTRETSSDFEVVVQNGQPVYPHDPLGWADYNKNNYSGNGGSVNPSSAGMYYNVQLNSTGISWINKGGITKFAVRSSRDINGNAPRTPSVYQHMEEWTYIDTSEAGVSRAPKLTVVIAPLNPVISVTPTSAQDFGSVSLYGTRDISFTVRNTGGGALSGSVSGLVAPFSCVSGCSYSLGAGASQPATIRFSPTSIGSFSDTAEFSGAAGASRDVSGSGITPRCIPTGTTNVNYTVSQSSLGGSSLCEISGDDGVEGGNFTIGSGVTVQINANSRLVFNDGKHITVGGIIAKSATNAKVIKGHLALPPTTYTLTVNSSGTTGISITGNPSTYSGTTNYTKSSIVSGTSLTLTAPASSGSY